MCSVCFDGLAWIVFFDGKYIGRFASELVAVCKAATLSANIRLYTGNEVIA